MIAVRQLSKRGPQPSRTMVFLERDIACNDARTPDFDKRNHG
jgi:hypothetical protein